MAICWGEPAGAAAAAGCGAACCWAACRAAACRAARWAARRAAARAAALLRAAAFLASAAAMARCASTTLSLIRCTPRESTPGGPLSWRLAAIRPACAAPAARGDRTAAEAGQRATAPEAAAPAATTVDVATAIVSRDGLLCIGLWRRGKTDLCSGAGSARGYHPWRWLSTGSAGAGSGVQTWRGSGDGVAGGNRHARWVLSVLHTAQRCAVLWPESTPRVYEMNHTANVPVTNFVAVFTIPLPVPAPAPVLWPRDTGEHGPATEFALPYRQHIGSAAE